MNRKIRRSIILFFKTIRKVIVWVFSKEGALVTVSLAILAGAIGYKIQDAVQKQRYLELLELELRGNANNASVEVKDVTHKNYLYFHQPLHNEVYNAGLNQGYLITLDPVIQAQLYTLYTNYFPNINDNTSHMMNVINLYHDKWEQCALENLNNKSIKSNNDPCAEEHTQYLEVQKLYSNYIAQEDLAVIQMINKINFNPTNDRLHGNTIGDLILRLFMGNQSLKIQQ